ncbi:hypothetical protein VTL71DRAFT_15435 [Oculimacula yallundae]|uniref:Uncharacterized protein n=1 Tax=Oculimacula yallundae TaxID=86028 RepID=A0ABR4CGK0_9HELO
MTSTPLLPSSSIFFFFITTSQSHSQPPNFQHFQLNTNHSPKQTTSTLSTCLILDARVSVSRSARRPSLNQPSPPPKSLVRTSLVLVTRSLPPFNQTAISQPHRRLVTAFVVAPTMLRSKVVVSSTASPRPSLTPVCTPLQLRR